MIDFPEEKRFATCVTDDVTSFDLDATSASFVVLPIRRGFERG